MGCKKTSSMVMVMGFCVILLNNIFEIFQNIIIYKSFGHKFIRYLCRLHGIPSNPNNWPGRWALSKERGYFGDQKWTNKQVHTIQLSFVNKKNGWKAHNTITYKTKLKNELLLKSLYIINCNQNFDFFKWNA